LYPLKKSKEEIFKKIADDFLKIGPRFPTILASNIIGNRIGISAFVGDA
jgi:hypothetical protein